MSDNFLTTLMEFALQKTGAERALAVDTGMNVLGAINLDDEAMQARDFNAMDCVRRALNNGEPLITNNAVIDPNQAPITNTQFRNLRLVIVIPVAGFGAVYLDQTISKGVISKETVNRLMTLAADTAGNETVSMDDLAGYYQTLA